MTKVVYNSIPGEFSLSQDTLSFMFELGSQYVKENPEYNAKHEYGDEDSKKWWEQKYIFDKKIPRHDEILVKAICEDVSNSSKVSIKEVSKKYIIVENSGSEVVIQPDDIEWIEV